MNTVIKFVKYIYKVAIGQSLYPTVDMSRFHDVAPPTHYGFETVKLDEKQRQNILK